jgi:hypothetical protein
MAATRVRTANMGTRMAAMGTGLLGTSEGATVEDVEVGVGVGAWVMVTIPGALEEVNVELSRTAWLLV